MAGRNRRLRSALFATLALFLSGTTAGADPPSDLTGYTIFGVQSLNLGDRAFIGGGNVGVNDAAGELHLGSFGFLAEGSALVGATTRLGKGTSVFDLFTNDLLTSPANLIVRGAGPTAFTAPVVGALPPLPSFAPGTAPLTVKREEVHELAPGAYGETVVARRGTLVLTGGT